MKKIIWRICNHIAKKIETDDNDFQEYLKTYQGYEDYSELKEYLDSLRSDINGMQHVTLSGTTVSGSGGSGVDEFYFYRRSPHRMKKIIEGFDKIFKNKEKDL